MLNPFKSLFPEKIVARPDVPFSAEELAGPVRINRQTLQLIDNWIDDKAFSTSCFNYGVPDLIKAVINKPLGETITYTDLMVLICRKYFPAVNYLELGVSVGKNFYQLLSALPKGKFTGFDIEEINPVLARHLDQVDKKDWLTPGVSLKKVPSSLTSYRSGDKEVKYLSADVWDEASWERLSGNKFNLVFSDALHTPKAILFEYKMLEKYRLLDDRFVIVWDDLVGKMENSFHKMVRQYNKTYGLKEIFLLHVNGWVGQHENPHTVGIISNFAF